MCSSESRPPPYFCTFLPDPPWPEQLQGLLSTPTHVFSYRGDSTVASGTGGANFWGPADQDLVLSIWAYDSFGDPRPDAQIWLVGRLEVNGSIKLRAGTGSRAVTVVVTLAEAGPRRGTLWLCVPRAGRNTCHGVLGEW